MKRQPIFHLAIIFFISVNSILLAKTKLDEKGFQEWIIPILRRHFSKADIQKDNDPKVVRINGDKYGLTNIYRIYLESEALAESTIIDHFNRARLARDKQDVNTWKAAKNLIRPQIIPQDYAEEYKFFGIRNIGKDLVVAYVLDMHQGYQYVSREDQAKFSITESEMFETAVTNLETASKGMEIKKIGEDIVILNLHDSYDATRILLPRLRGKIAKLIGKQFYFAIPNRDFLICWSKTSSKEVVNRLLQQVKKDFETQPYPISPKIFIDGEDIK